MQTIRDNEPRIWMSDIVRSPDRHKRAISGAVFGIILALNIVPAYLFLYRNLAKVPGVNRIYYFVADDIHRPPIDREYAYDRWEDLHADLEAPHVTNGRLRREDASMLWPSSGETCSGRSG